MWDIAPPMDCSGSLLEAAPPADLSIDGECPTKTRSLLEAAPPADLSIDRAMSHKTHSPPAVSGVKA